MNYSHTIADFAQRTIVNLRHIELIDEAESRERIPPNERRSYPVTQLINSLLGLIVFPKEGYERHIEDVSLQELAGLGWPALRIEHPTPNCPRNGDHRECTTLPELVRVLRNGVSHFNVNFSVDQHGCEIEAVRLANRCNRCRQETTAVTMSLPELREIAVLYANSIIQRAVEEDGYRASDRAFRIERSGTPSAAAKPQ